MHLNNCIHTQDRGRMFHCPVICESDEFWISSCFTCLCAFCFINFGSTHCSFPVSYVLAHHGIILFGFWLSLVKQIINQILFGFIDCPCYINLNSLWAVVALKTGVLLCYWNCTKVIVCVFFKDGLLISVFICMWHVVVSYYSYMFTVKFHVMSAVSAMNDSKNIFLSWPNSEWYISVIITCNNFVFQNVPNNCHSLPSKCPLCANFITREIKMREN
jgi:hypothetical protein